MKNIVMKGTGVYIPPNKVYNEDIDKHFDERGLSAHSLMEHLGRRKRYFISEGETAITMCVDAIRDCLDRCDMKAEDVEMVIVTTDTPEYLSPTNALKVVSQFGEEMRNVSVAFDINANCTGMVMGVDVVKQYMIESRIHRALVVGVFCVTPNALWDDTVVYASFADAAACVALELVDEDSKRGIIDTEVYLDASYHEYVTYPKCGMSKVALKSVQPNKKRLEWNPFDMDFLSDKWNEIIRNVLKRHSMEPNDVDYYVFSQLSDVYNIRTLDLLGVSVEDNKYHFLGKEYGYTGNTCPFLCLNRMWASYSQPGNRIIICTVGAGYTAIAMLYEF